MYGPAAGADRGGRVEQLLRLVGRGRVRGGGAAVRLHELRVDDAVDGFARIAVSCVAGVADFMTTVYFPCAETLMPASRKAGLPFMLMSRLSEKTTSADVSGAPFGEVDVRLELERERLRAVRGLPRLHEQRDRVREVALVVGEERVVDRAIDDRRGRVECALRVRRLDRERVVDHERRRSRRARRRAECRERAHQCESCGER